MYSGGLRSPTFITGGGQPPASTIARNDDLFSACSRVSSSRTVCQGSVGKWRRPRTINSHVSTEATGGWGPWRSALAPSLLC